MMKSNQVNKDTALILLAHGSKDPLWAGPVMQLRDLLRARDRIVEVAFLESMTPNLGDAIERLIQANADVNLKAIDIFPVFFGVGTHLRQDLPRLCQAEQQRFLHITLRVLPALGQNAAMLRAIAETLMV